MSENAPQAGWVLILGATAGIGKALARHWAAQGKNLLLAARDVDEAKRLAIDLTLRFSTQAVEIAFDALAFDDHERFWRDCLSRAGGTLEGVILCYGYMAAQSDAARDPKIARQTLDVNYTSAVSVLNLVANDFEQAKRGYICGFSSVAGDRGRQSNYLYGSSKAAFSTYLQGLRNRLFRTGVKVITVKPGFVDTGMTWGLPGMFLVADPEKVAGDTWRAIHRGRPVLYTPWFWRYTMLIIRTVPEFVFKRMKM